LRVGISPDLTVAYLDFIFEDGVGSIHRPLNKIGQPRFPLALRICGLGTYFSPWYIDTNDILLQAISQSTEFAMFIDKSWINFILELNNILKTMRKHHLKSDLLKLFKFLTDESKIGGLGGLIIQFCTFISELPTNAIDGSRLSSPSLLTSYPRGDSTVPTPPSRKSVKFSHRTNTSSVENVADPFTEFGKLENKNRRPTGDHTMVSFIFGREHDDETSLADSVRHEEESKTRQKQESRDIPRSRNQSAESLSSGNVPPLTYEETCHLLELGMRLPGLVIFHESTPLFEVVHSPDQPLLLNELQSTSLRRFSNPPLPNPAAETRESILDAERDADSIVDMKNTAREVYGDRADELTQFYRIVREADKSSGLHAMGTNFSDQNTSTQNVMFAETREEESLPLPSPLLVEGEGEHQEYISQASEEEPERETFPHLDEHRSLSGSQESMGRRSLDENDRRALSMRWQTIQDNSAYVRSSGHLSHVNIWYWSSATHTPTQLKISEERTSIISPSISQLVESSSLPPPQTLPRPPFYLAQQDFRDLIYYTPFFRQYEEEEAYGIYLFELLESAIITSMRYVSHSHNALPYTSPIYRKLAAMTLFTLIVVDIGFSCVISINFWCIWDNYTLCEDHTGFILGVVMWPGALTLTPIVGLLAVAVNPTGIFARHYVSWSRLAALSLITLFTIYFYWYQQSPYSTLYFLLGMAVSRFGQLVIADRFIASHEALRTSRGWGGMFTNILNDEYAFR
jgi:hypothetical protein